MNYLIRLLIALDILCNVALCNGSPVETMSSTVYCMERDGHFWGFMRPVIDTLARCFGSDKGHCYRSYVECRNNAYAPPEFRK
jgi:hypothetical protein